jgi:peptidoglycan/LPS O-acetylase OafA/YrhL
MATFWASILVSYVIAIASWYLLEKPILRLKRFFDNKAVWQGDQSVALRRTTGSEIA